MSLGSTIDDAILIIKDAVDQFQGSQMSNVTCSAGEGEETLCFLDITQFMVESSNYYCVL